MSQWLDINRNLPFNIGVSVYLFTLDRTLYTLVRIVNGVPSVLHIYQHLGSDPPVVDELWDAVENFPPIAQGFQYDLKGWTEDSAKVYVYIVERSTGTIFRNTTSGVIDQDWDYITGPFGSPNITGNNANLWDVIFFQDKLHVSHRGGVARYDESTGEWTSIGLWIEGSNGIGDVKALKVFQNELYATVTFKDIGIVYKWNENVDKPEEWEKVAELPLQSLDPSLLTIFNNDRIIVGVADVDQNIFSSLGIDNTLTGIDRFTDGEHLKGVPISIITYSRDGSVWMTTVESEFATLGYYIGDVNADGVVDFTDVEDLIDFITLSKAPANIAAADVNGDGTTSVLDVVALNDYINGTFDYGAIYDTAIDTTGPNKITSLTVPDEEFVTDDNIFDYSLFQFNRYGNDSKAFTPLESSTLARIIFPDQLASPHLTPKIEDSWGDFRLNAMDSHSTVDSNRIKTLLDTRKQYTVTCEVEVTPREEMNFTGTGNGANSTITQFRIRMGFHPFDDIVGDNTLRWDRFFDTAKFPIGTINFLPDITLSTNTFTKQLSFAFDAAILRNTDIWIGDAFGVRIRIVIDVVHWDDINLNETLVNSVVPKWALYRPTIQINNLTIDQTGAAIFPNTSYIVKRHNEIPDVDLTSHKVVLPSGPDQWYIRFHDTSDPVNILFPGVITPSFLGDAQYRVRTNPINFEAGKSYIANCIVRAPEGTPHTLNMSITSPIGNALTEDANIPRQILNFVHNGIPTGGSTAESYPISTTFTIPEDATSLEIDNIPVTFKVVSKNISAADPGRAILMSDINIIEKITGNTINRIYRYNGQKWEDSVATTGLHDNSANYLTEVFDIASSEYQLYCISKGRVHVWHYPGGRYSGSAAGISSDIRPQIVNVL